MVSYFIGPESYKTNGELQFYTKNIRVFVL
jgi:hypothetical protein